MTKFFTNEGKPEDADWVKKKEEDATAYFEGKSMTDKVVEHYLQKINFDVLNGILSNICRKSGIPEDEIQKLYLSRQNIIVSTTARGNSYAEHSASAGRIVLVPDRIKRGTFADKRPLSDLVFELLIHEAVHHFSLNRNWGERKLSDSSRLLTLLNLFGIFRKSKTQSGYKESLTSMDQRTWKFRRQVFRESFNEFVTQKITLEVMQEYLKLASFPISEKNFKKLSDDVRIKIADSIISQTARGSGFPHEVVWGAIKRGYFGGDNSQEESLRALKDQLPAMFYKAIVEGDVEERGT